VNLAMARLVRNVVDPLAASPPAGSKGIATDIQDFAATALNVLANAVAIERPSHPAKANSHTYD